MAGDPGPPGARNRAIAQLKLARKALYAAGDNALPRIGAIRTDIDSVLAYLQSVRPVNSAVTKSSIPRPACQSVAGLDTPSSSYKDTSTGTRMSPSPVLAQSGGQGGMQSKGGDVVHAAASMHSDHPSRTTSERHEPIISPPSEEVGVSRSLALELSESIQKLTTTISGLSTRMDGLERRATEGVHGINSAAPPPPARSYAAIVAAPASLAAQTRPQTSAALADPTPNPIRTVVTIATSDLAPDHFLRTLPGHCLLPSLRRMMVSMSLDPHFLLYARRMERGDVQVKTAHATAVALFRRALASHPDAIHSSLPVERSSVVLHFVSTEAEAEDVMAAVEAATREKPVGARRLGQASSKASGSWLVELEKESSVSTLVHLACVQVRGRWVDVERAKSLAHRKAEAAKRGGQTRTETRLSMPVASQIPLPPSPSPTPAPSRPSTLCRPSMPFSTGNLESSVEASLRCEETPKMAKSEATASMVLCGDSTELTLPHGASLGPRSPTPTARDLCPSPLPAGSGWDDDMSEEIMLQKKERISNVATRRARRVVVRDKSSDSSPDKLDLLSSSREPETSASRRL